MAQIRIYEPSTDFAECVTIFRNTADSSLHYEPLWTLASYLWCRPYLILSPSTCMVLSDESNKAVGYCIGTPSTAAFSRAWRSKYLPTLSRQEDPTAWPEDEDPSTESDRTPTKVDELLHVLWRDPESGMSGNIPELWDEYPGHLHIDILPSHQGSGFGPKLIAALLDRMRKEGCIGVHLGVVSSNMRALAFYEREGFTSFRNQPTHGQSIIMVKKL